MNAPVDVLAVMERGNDAALAARNKAARTALTDDEHAELRKLDDWLLDGLKARAAVAELVAAVQDVESSLDPEWAADNVCTETAIETLIEALARIGGSK